MSAVATPQSTSEPENTNPPVVVDGIRVEGDVNGNIIVGNNNIIYSPNITHGDVINNYTQSVEPHLRAMKPQPPYMPRGFVGRESILETLEKQIKAGEAISVYGQDGLGKTTLVKVAANGAAAKSRSDGVMYVEGINHEEGTFLGFRDIVQQFFNALFESNPPLKVDIPTARTYLSNTAPLVILDHYELPAQSLITVRDLFPRGAILATARDEIFQDNYLGEAVHPLKRNESISLLSSKAGYENNASNSVELNKICDLLADVPLAIIKTANLIRNKKSPLGTVAEQLGKIRPPAGDRIHTAIMLSYGLIFSALNENERSLLSHVAAAPGISVDRDWLKSLNDGETASTSLESMELLQANSPRLRLAEGLRSIVLNTSKSPNLARESLFEYLLEQLKSKSLDFEFVRGELGNILGLVKWLFQQERWSDVITLGKAVDPYLTLHGLWDARDIVLNLVLHAALTLEINDPQIGRAAQAWALHQLGSMNAGFDSKEQARDILTQALEIRNSLNDKAGAAFTQRNIWVLFPPVAVKEPDPEPSLTKKTVRFIQEFLYGLGMDGIQPIIILALVALIVAAILALINLRWKTYRDDNFGFEFRYPARSELTTLAAGGLGIIRLPTGANEAFDKSLTVTANRDRDENKCDIPINPDSWVVEPITLENNQFLKATKRTGSFRETGNVVYATPKESERGTWVCLIFTYSPREPISDKPIDTFTGAEIAIFEKIIATFRWLPIPPPTETFTGTPPTITITATDTYTPTLTNTPTDTHTPTVTYTPTLTITPTFTSTFTPTFTNTPCVYPLNWFVYTVQRGDTLFGISQWYELSWQELARANCKTSNIIIAGESLYVPRQPPFGSITGYLFADLNKNNIQDSNETRLSNVRVSLRDVNGTSIKTFDTNDKGEYNFLDLTYGTYYIFDVQFNIKPAQTIEHNFGLAPAPYPE